MKSISIAIIGGTGKLGKEVTKLCKNTILISSKTPRASIPFDKVDLFLDVSKADIIMNYLPQIIKAKKPLVVGSTGHCIETLHALEKASLSIPILVAANFSKGVFLLKNLLKHLPVPSEITETHHIHKKDKPSGTAKDLASIYDTPPKITSIREDLVFGIHKLSFTFPSETLEITHKAESRALFAEGALEACSFLYQKEKGYYTMEDVYKEER